MENRYNTKPGRVFDAFNIVLLGAVGILALLPFLFVIAGSFATEAELTRRSFFLWPEEFTLGSYEAILQTPAFLRAMATTIGVTATGTVIQLALTVCMAYPLSKRALPGRNIILSLVVFTMVFSAGMIPTFLVGADPAHGRQPVQPDHHQELLPGTARRAGRISEN
jgi:putative aldouronate transport system permease protein